MDLSKELKPVLKIDFREQRSGIFNEIAKQNDQIVCELCNLITGDYLIQDKIIVERKTLYDFLESIKTGRIFQQAYRMAQTEMNGLIILEGDKSMVDSSGMSRRAVQGALIHLTVFIGVPVIRSKDIHETAALLIDLHSQCQRQELPRKKQIIHGVKGLKLNKKQRQKLFLIQNLPGIGIKRGLALLDFFSTFENILKAVPEDLVKVGGIGNKLGNSIYSILHEPF
ncbi:MAG: ERCC4 domain-containing protein [Mariniphaga sp.]